MLNSHGSNSIGERAYGMKFFSHKHRPVHMGPYPYELLKRLNEPADFSDAPRVQPLHFDTSPSPARFIRSMPKVLANILLLRDGEVTAEPGPVPENLAQRAQTMKSWVYHEGLVAAGVCKLDRSHILDTPLRPDATLQGAIEAHMETARAMAAKGPNKKGVAVPAMSEKENAPLNVSFDKLQHTHALVILAENKNMPKAGEPGYSYLENTEDYFSTLAASEVAVLVAGYLRTIGFSARAHSRAISEVDLNQLALLAGVAEVKGGTLSHPYLKHGFSVAVVTTNMAMQPDKPLAPRGIAENLDAFGPTYQLGLRGTRQGLRIARGDRRPLHMGKHPMEKIKRREHTTTLIDEANIPRVPKRHDMFMRGAFGDLGEKIQGVMKGLNGMLAEPYNHVAVKMLAGSIPLQDGNVSASVMPDTDNAEKNADDIKAVCYAVGSDMVGICKAKPYMWYSHQLDGSEIVPYHKNAIVMLLDQGYETMSASSGDDWITGSQGPKGYRRGSLTACMVAEHIRNLGYSARVHSLIDQDVLHIPMLLEAGIGELSRIGELVLNPFMGPRFKSVVVTTDMPLEADKPIDFGLQDFCNQCLKCARECPVGAIPYGDKIMFNGYETWKQDVEKCVKYRVTNPAGVGCGRCMKTCPWNTEGVLSEHAFIQAAIKLPFTRPWIAKLDDWLGNGKQNPVKRWWFDLIWREGKIVKPERTNAHDLNLDRKMDHEKQKTAIFPYDIAPAADEFSPVKIVEFRKEAQQLYKAAEKPDDYKKRMALDKT
jgi:reductive dehalogenase